MEKGKWNMPLVAGVWGVYWIFFIIYLFYSRTPDYFTGTRTEGEVTGTYKKMIRAGKSWATMNCPIVNYYVDSVQYELYSERESFSGLYEKGDKVTLVYDRHNPKDACILGLMSYWININEILIAFLIIGIITAFITVVPNGYDERFTNALKK